MGESMRGGFKREKPVADGPKRKSGYIDISANLFKERKVDSDSDVEYDQTLKRVMLEFGNEILRERDQAVAVPTNLEMMLKNYDTPQLVNEIKDTKKEQWKGREVMFKAVVDEIYLRLWAVRNKFKGSKNKSGSILKIK